MKKVMLPLVLSTFLLTGCLAGPNNSKGTPGPNGKIANFWNGLWDGMVSPISFVVSLFSENVEVYNAHSDSWYTFGFVMGAGILGGSTSSSSKR